MYGRIDYVLFLVQKGATDWDNGLYGACRGGHVNLVKLMIKYGATNFDEGLYECANSPGYKNTDICNILVANGATDIGLLTAMNEFKLYHTWFKSKGKKKKMVGDKRLHLLMEYPPYVLLVGSRLSKHQLNCYVSKLPVELFTLLTQY